MRVEVIRELEELGSHAAAWDVMATRAVPALPYGRPGWIIPWLRHQRPPEMPWAAYLAYADDDSMCGALVTTGRRSRRMAAGDHSPLASLILAAGEGAADTLASLLRAMATDVPRAHSLRVRGLLEDTTAAAVLRAGVAGWHCRKSWTRDTMGRVPADDNEEQLLGGLSRSAREKLSRGERRLAEQGPVQLVLRTGLEEARDTLAAFLTLEQCGWKGRRGTGVACKPELIAFYAAVVEALAPVGGLLWHVLTVGPHVVAMEMLLRAGTMLVVHKVTFDEQFAQASPGHVLWAHTLRWAANNPEIHEVELLTFDHIARRWGARPMALGSALLCPRALGPTISAWWPEQVRTALRGIPGVRPASSLARRLFIRH